MQIGDWEAQWRLWAMPWAPSEEYIAATEPEDIGFDRHEITSLKLNHFAKIDVGFDALLELASSSQHPAIRACCRSEMGATYRWVLVDYDLEDEDVVCPCIVLTCVHATTVPACSSIHYG